VSATTILFAVVLVLAAVLAWFIAARAKPAGRPYVRFAGVLYIALAVSGLVPESGDPAGAFARAVALVVCVLAPCTLALALVGMFRKSGSSALAAIFLPLACLGGLGAAATDATAFGFVPLAIATAATAIAAVRAFSQFRIASLQALAASVSFVCAASSLMAGGSPARASLYLFSAAGLLGSALALARGSRAGVENGGRQALRRVLAVREER
jgi:hypothetical protein